MSLGDVPEVFSLCTYITSARPSFVGEMRKKPKKIFSCLTEGSAPAKIMETGKKDAILPTIFGDRVVYNMEEI